MKVSRKVTRRSRSSISRRRLRNKNRKHTKTIKRGKQGRGQKRMRARTHKRGKRFHRGGKLIGLFRGPGPTSFDEKTGVITNLRYSKNSSDRVDNFSISLSGSDQLGFTITFNRIDGDRPLIFKFKSTSLIRVIDIMKQSFTDDNTITNSSDDSDHARYQLKLDGINLGYIQQYIHNKVYAPKVKPVSSVKDFFSDKIAAEARAAEARAAEDDAAAESTP
jgi:hypothetical protein